MTYAKLDDLYDTKRKIKKAWKAETACVGLHAMAIAYCTREKTDGIVDSAWVEEKLPNKLKRTKVIGLMVELQLLDPVNPPVNSDLTLEYWRLHDYLDYNDSREKRAELSAAGKAGAEARWAKDDMRSASKPHSQPDADRNAMGNGPPTPHHTIQTPVDLKQRSEVGLIFDAWVSSTRRDATRTKLSPERRRVIVKALGSHGFDAVEAAVQGWEQSAYHRGENSTSTVYNDLELLLRNAAHIEKFRDLHSGATSQSTGSVSDYVERDRVARQIVQDRSA